MHGMIATHYKSSNKRNSVPPPPPSSRTGSEIEFTGGRTARKRRVCGQVNTFAFVGTGSHPQIHQGQLGRIHGSGNTVHKSVSRGGDRIPVIEVVSYRIRLYGFVGSLWERSLIGARSVLGNYWKTKSDL